MSDEVFAVVDASGRRIDVPVRGAGAGASLAAAIWLSGRVPPPALCSGLGRCGSCRVRFLSDPPPPVEQDVEVLGRDAVGDGWRLACRCRPAAGMVVQLPPLTDATSARVRRAEPGTSFAPGSLRLAVDLGTTSVQWRLLADPAAGSFSRSVSGGASGSIPGLNPNLAPDPDRAGPAPLILGEGSCLNPQMGAGSDVISRVAAAMQPGGRTRLRELVLDFLRQLTEEAATRWGETVAEVCVAGNTAMTAILLDADLSGLAGAPYRVPCSGGETVSLPGLPPVWIPPQPAPFVGGDVSAGMAPLLYAPGSEAFPLLLADLGTNGEFVLAPDRERAFIASVPLGPSLEGIGLSRGGVAAPGRADRFTLGPTGLTPSFIGGRSSGEARICGTGYLSLLECLLRAGLLDASGRLAARPTPLAGRLSRDVRREGGGGWRLDLPEGLVLAAEDVEEILKVKAAFSLAWESLLASAGLAARDVACVILGGALGRHAPTSALETLGFLPPGLGSRVRAAGNTSLEGAAFLLIHPRWRTPLTEWSRNCIRVELTGRDDFTRAYMRHMRFGSD